MRCQKTNKHRRLSQERRKLEEITSYEECICRILREVIGKTAEEVNDFCEKNERLRKKLERLKKGAWQKSPGQETASVMTRVLDTRCHERDTKKDQGEGADGESTQGEISQKNERKA